MWTYKNKEVTEIPNDDYEGFVYKITHKPSGQYYIGKKSFWSRRNKKIGKRRKKQLRAERKAKGIGGRLPKKELVVKESKWKSYFSSNESIKEMIGQGREEEFEREILKFCRNKKQLTYYEQYYQMKEEVLLDDKSYNNNIAGKFYRKDFID